MGLNPLPLGAILPGPGEALTFTADDVRVFGKVVCDRGDCAIAFDTPISVAEVQALRARAEPSDR